MKQLKFKYLKRGRNSRDLTILGALESELRILKENMTSRDVKIDPIKVPDVECIIQEVSDRQRRKNNIILYNVSENVLNNRNDQVAAEMELVGELLQMLDVSVDNLRTIRLGKFDSSRTDMKRPIKVSERKTRNSALPAYRASDHHNIDHLRTTLLLATRNDFYVNVKNRKERLSTDKKLRLRNWQDKEGAAYKEPNHHCSDLLSIIVLRPYFKWGNGSNFQDVECSFVGTFPGAPHLNKEDLEWSAGSLNLAPCDSFLWGFLKSHGYVNRPRTCKTCNLTAAKCLNLLPNHIISSIEILHIDEPQFPMVGATPYSTRAVKNF
ncbi:hypothetical protein Trydic_g17007 [Trypoxylus dichotomus]